MKTLTFYQPIPMFRDERNLVDLWKARWSKLGFSPVVLGQDAINRDKWFAHVGKFALLPSANAQVYELACWQRWCAYSDYADALNLKHDESMLVSDYDIFNTGLAPDRFRGGEPMITAFDSSAMIGCVRVTRATLNMMPDMLLAAAPHAVKIEQGRTHVSDMLAFIKMREAGLVACNFLGRQYNDRQFGACLIHLSNDTARSLHKTKPELWAELEKEFPLCQ